MQYKGVEYRILQTANPTGFKWIVQLEENRTRTGTSALMRTAILDAQRKIDRELKAIKVE